MPHKKTSIEEKFDSNILTINEKTDNGHEKDGKSTEGKPGTAGHKIKTYEVGLPGEPVLAANAKNREQLIVNLLEAESVEDIRKILIKQSELNAAEKLKDEAGLSFDEKGDLAGRALTHNQGINKLCESLYKLKDEILIVKPESVDNKQVQKGGEFFLAPEATVEELSASLENLDFSRNEVNKGSKNGRSGMVFKKGDLQLTFLFSEEQGQKDKK